VSDCCEHVPPGGPASVICGECFDYVSDYRLFDNGMSMWIGFVWLRIGKGVVLLSIL
jgi:hypothetical protein